MNLSRRNFMQQAVAGAAALSLGTHWAFGQEGSAKLRLSACDWSLGAKGPEGLDIAKQTGLDGLEISAEGPADAVSLADPAIRAQYKEMVSKTGVAISSVAMGFLNGSPLAEDARGPAWLEQTIDAAQDLGAPVILIAFFGKGDLKDREGLKAECVDVVVDRIKAAAPRAEKAGVILGLENTLSAADNMAILDRVQSNAVRVYYDVGNSTSGGYDVPGEIRTLGDRICQIHLKDGGHYLGEGKVDMPAAQKAIQDIGYKGWLVLETAIPSKDRDADFKRNAEYARKLFGMA
jgi:sugar phosphate isomerase/epimerase